MNIKVKQRDITDCGAACLSSIAAYYKLGLPVARIRQLASTDKKGTNVLGIIKAAEHIGFSAKGVKGGIDALPEIPLPAIAHVVVLAYWCFLPQMKILKPEMKKYQISNGFYFF